MTSTEQLLTGVTTTCEILHALGRNRNASLHALATETGYDRSTIRRHLRTLEAGGFVYEQREGGVFTPSFRLLEHGDRKRTDWPLFRDGRPLIDTLATDTGGEASIVTTTFADHLAHLYRRRGPEAAAAFGGAAPSGTTVPPHATAAGKAILASLRPADADMFLDDEFPAHTDRTITGREGLASQISAVAEEGVAKERQEYRPDRCAVAAPVADPRDTFAHAVSVALPADSFDDHVEGLGDKVQNVATELTTVVEEWYYSSNES